MASHVSLNELHTPASVIVEQIALENSSAVFVYDLAEEAGFGTYTIESKLKDEGSSRHIEALQTRAGAGLNIAGRLSDSRNSNKEAVFTAYNTPEGVAAMSASLHSLPKPTSRSRLIILVPTISTIENSLEITPTVAALNPIIDALPDSFVVLFSSTPQELVDLALLSYTLEDRHVVHVFDQYSAGRELGHDIVHRRRDGMAKLKDPHSALQSLDYGFFDYTGSKSAEDIIVMLNGPLSTAFGRTVKDDSQLGLVSIRVLKPWDEEALLSVLPENTRNVYVLDDVQGKTSHGPLYAQVFASLLTGSKSGAIAVKAVKVLPSLLQEFLASPASFSRYIANLTGKTSPIPEENNTLDKGRKRLLFFGSPSSTLATLPHQIISSFWGKNGISAKYLVDYDILSKSGAISKSRAVVTTDAASYTPSFADLPSGAEEMADFIAILDQNLLKSHSLVESAKHGSAILLVSSWSASEVSSSLPGYTASSLREKGAKLYNVNVKDIEDDGGPNAVLICAYLAFFRLYLGNAAKESTLRQFANVFRTDNSLNLDKLNAKAWSLLEEVDITTPEQEEAPKELKRFTFNAVKATSIPSAIGLPGAYLSSWHEAARHIIFRDVYGSDEVPTVDKQDPSLRPEIPDNTFLVTCTVNRRLTPTDYDRNVFHLEFDTSGTGLKYAIGEALGVHGWNDEDEVKEFCAWYGADPDKLITIPVPGVEDRLHTRTVFQALQQQIDLFGKPPKSFYSSLADYAGTAIDKLTLQFIGSAEGSSTFKKLSEKETVNFADILRRYPSAKPPIEVLCELIGDIKPRHYSIASAQSVVGDRVDLLVVTVEWATPSGSPRYGQCTRYLAGLKVGQKVTVSIKPSVMKLPPDDMQPLILAGLGTGAAPFRAFLQHRALMVSQGKAVGPLYYYFGSRYRSKEYLYGEEIEAYILDETITRCGLAFSRDTKKKVYIQHLMTEDAETLATMLRRDNGVFYLCGPTWPVPDVFEALVGALVKNLGMEEKEAGDYLEGLKEEERYVLEVY